MLGAGPWRRFRDVDLALAGRAVLVGGGFAFAISLGEFGATSVLARTDTPTVTMAIGRFLGRPGAASFRSGGGHERGAAGAHLGRGRRVGPTRPGGGNIGRVLGRTRAVMDGRGRPRGAAPARRGVGGGVGPRHLPAVARHRAPGRPAADDSLDGRPAGPASAPSPGPSGCAWSRSTADEPTRSWRSSAPKLDGREHSPWVLRAELTPHGEPAPSRRCASTTAVRSSVRCSERLLGDTIEEGRDPSSCALLDARA